LDAYVFNLNPGLGLSPFFSLLYVSHHRSLSVIGQKKAYSNSLDFGRDTLNSRAGHKIVISSFVTVTRYWLAFLITVTLVWESTSNDVTSDDLCIDFQRNALQSCWDL